MSENNYGNNQGNAQNPYAAQPPNSSAQSSYGQDYGQAPSAQNTYGQDYSQDYGQSASAQNTYGQAQQNLAQQNQYGQFGAQSSCRMLTVRMLLRVPPPRALRLRTPTASSSTATGSTATVRIASYQGQPAQQNQYGYGQTPPTRLQPADYNYQQNSYQQQPQQGAYGYGQPAGYPYAAPVTKKAPGMALAAMILGIAAVLTGFLVFVPCWVSLRLFWAPCP